MKTLSEPISNPCPPNKYRALSQQVCSLLMEKEFISVKVDFVGVINELEQFFHEMEQDGFIDISEEIYQD